MKRSLLLLLVCAPIWAQNFSATLLNSDLATAGPLSANFAFPDTPRGESSSFSVTLTYPGPNRVELLAVLVGSNPGQSIQSSDFTATNFDVLKILGPTGTDSGRVSFTPSTSGPLSGYLQVFYNAEENDCSLTDSAKPACNHPGYQVISTLTGTAVTGFSVSYTNDGVDTPLQPNASSRLDFGSVSTSATAALTFKITNQTSTAISTPAVSLVNGVFSSSAFSLNISALPTTIPANASATFLVTFAPGQTVLTTAALLVGSNTYGIEGTGTVVHSIDALQISYVDATGVRTSPQAATAISFGQLVPGTAGGAVLKFTVTNPQTSFDAVTLSMLSVAGTAYTLSDAPTLPAAIQPNASVTFAVTFDASTSGTYTGSLNIGGRVFNLTGLAVVSPVPAMSLVLSESTLASAEQVTATVQAASASQQDAIGQLTMQFTSAVSGVSDDPAIAFLTTSGRDLSLDLAKGTQTAAYQGQPDLTFQTGTTAGTITFTLTFPNTPPLIQSYTITPAQIHISSATAVRSDPNLVVTINGYDNTYSAGQMSFTFYDSKGNAMTAKPMAVDATSDFHEYFFTRNQAGGSFAVQATFPVTGDITQIDSVAVTMNNSAGQTGTKLKFQ